jgi:hypothetical protein
MECAGSTALFFRIKFAARLLDDAFISAGLSHRNQKRRRAAALQMLALLLRYQSRDQERGTGGNAPD